MSDDRHDQRERLLRRVFARGTAAREGAAAGNFDPALLSDIIAGLVFAQRPINAAGKDLAAQYGLGPRGTFILGLVNSGVRYPKDLATVLRIGRSLISAEISRLSEAGLIAGAAGEDRRRTELSLTPLGQAVNGAVRARLRTSLENSLAEFSTEQITLFADMLRAVGQGPAG